MSLTTGTQLAFAALAASLLLSGCTKPQKPLPPPRQETMNVSLVRESPANAHIAGLGALKGFANGRDCTFMHCLEIVLDGLGRKFSYDDLMGVSGLAFRFQIRQDTFDTSNADPMTGVSVLDPLFNAVGWDYDLRVVPRDNLIGADALVQAIHDSVDRGVPVLAANVIPPEDWGIIVGYRQQSQWLCRSYNGGAESSDQVATGWPTAVVLLTNRRTRQASMQMHVDAIRRAVEMWEQSGTGNYAVGRRAFDAWIELVRAPRDNRYVHANFWTYISLIDARAAAVRYLQANASQFGPKDRYLQMAAEWYDQEVKLLIQNLRYVPSGKTNTVTIPPAETRNQQIEAIRSAKALEEKAIDSLKRAR